MLSTVEIHRKCHEESMHEPIFVDSVEEGARNLESKKCKYMMTAESTGLSRSQGEYCGIMVMTGDLCFSGGSSFLLPRGSNLTRPMSKATLEMNQAGSLPTIEKHVRSGGQCRTNQHKTLTLKQLRLFFIFAFVACFLLLLEMILDPQEPPFSENSRCSSVTPPNGGQVSLSPETSSECSISGQNDLKTRSDSETPSESSVSCENTSVIVH